MKGKGRYSKNLTKFSYELKADYETAYDFIINYYEWYVKKNKNKFEKNSETFRPPPPALPLRTKNKFQ